MRELSILYQGAMVRAILAGTKTQTRRLLKLPHGLWETSPSGELVPIPAGCPYGAPGDRLWVRETFYAFGRWETRYSAKKKRDEWHFIDMTIECGKAYAYAADGPPHDFKKGNQRSSVTPAWWKRPAIHMPRVASRITLEVTDVRVQRLQDISEADCWAEGVEEVMHDFDVASQCETAKRLGLCIDDAKPLYAQLWESINGPGSWDANPLVWVITFSRMKP